MAGKTRSSKEIDEQIKKLVALREKALERENRHYFSEKAVSELNKILLNHGYSLSEAEINSVFEPVRNLEEDMYRRKTQTTKTSKKEAA